MTRVFITGSSDGLGLMAARLLIEQGHEVIVHGRNEGRSREALAAAPGARGVVSGDLSTIAGTRRVVDEVNKLGRFDAVIHNAGVGYREGRVETEPGVPTVFAVNVLAPYILTALIRTPKRLVYVSSGMHRGVRPHMDDLLWAKRPWSGSTAYAESKLCDVLLAFAVARRWDLRPVVRGRDRASAQAASEITRAASQAKKPLQAAAMDSRTFRVKILVTIIPDGRLIGCFGLRHGQEADDTACLTECPACQRGHMVIIEVLKPAKPCHPMYDTS